MKPLQRWRWWRLSRRRNGLNLKPNPLAMPLPSPGTRVDQAPLLAIDLEMTGLSARQDEIISLGWVPVDAGRIRLHQACEIPVLQKDSASVGESATIHGIRDCDRHSGLSLQQALLQLLTALGGRIAVFHHAPLDVAFLQRALGRELDLGWPTPALDTLQWHRRRRLRRGDESAAIVTGLDPVRQHYGLDARSAHSALADAISCAEIAIILALRSGARLEDVCRVPSVSVPAQGSNRSG